MLRHHLAFAFVAIAIASGLVPVAASAAPLPLVNARDALRLTSSTNVLPARDAKDTGGRRRFLPPASLPPFSRPPPSSRPPVAFDDYATLDRHTTVTFAVTANDAAFGPAALDVASLDLDPATPGRQDQITTEVGSFICDCLGNVSFTPAPGFSGEATTPYTIADNRGRVSGPAHLIVTVNPTPNMLSSFEDGMQTWSSGSWQSNGGAVARTTSFATDGTHGLEITTADGGWFGRTFPALDLAAVKRIKIDVATGAAGTSHTVAVQVGTDWQWCQTDWGWINPDTTTTIDVDLATLFAACGVVDPSALQGLYVYFSSGGVYGVDHVRKEYGAPSDRQ